MIPGNCHAAAELRVRLALEELHAIGVQLSLVDDMAAIYYAILRLSCWHGRPP
jgi:hypothetical protein